MRQYIFRFVVVTLLFLSGGPLPVPLMAEKRDTNVATLPANRIVKGKVVDEQGKPMPGVTVRIKGTQMGTSTNVDGYFELPIPEGKYSLIFSFIGFRNRELDANTDLSRVVMQETAESLDEVVVTGYQKIDRKLFTGAASVVRAEELESDGANDIARMLQGKAAGVQIQNVSGTFGAAPKLRIRGSSSIFGEQKPLWVVDGIVLEDVVEISADELSSGDAQTLISSAVAGLNGDDIESFQILKDASATALYGARAMNGVIVITTKKGKVGRMSLNYSENSLYVKYQLIGSIT